MPRCAHCEELFPPDEEWIQLSHHHPNMTFESAFCSTECAAGYLGNDLQADTEATPGTGTEAGAK